MALRVSILPKQRSFRAGGELHATIQVANHSDLHSKFPFSIDITEFNVSCFSNERIDRNWIGPAYGASVQPKEKVNRHETREIMHSGPAHLSSKFKLLPGQQRQWNIRMALPEWLPPSFKGSAARFTFNILASIKFTSSPAGMKLLTQHLSIDANNRPSRGSLLTIPGRKGPKSKLLQEIAIEQTASASLPVLIHPFQAVSRDQNAFKERKEGATEAGGLYTGEDAELFPIPYSHNSSENPIIYVQEILKPRTSLSPTSLQSQSLKEDMDQRNGGLNPSNSGLPQTPPRLIQSNTWPLNDTTTSPRIQNPQASQLLQGKPVRQIPISPGVQGAGMTPVTAIEPGIMRTFNLRLSDQLLARVTLHPPTDNELSLGSTLAGTVDFRQSQQNAVQNPASPKCVQMIVVLETEERIQPQYSAITSASAPSSGIRQVQDEFQELTSDMLLTHFLLSVPTTAPASFSTQLVALHWLLKFEFVTMSEIASTGWLGGSSKNIDRLIWTLPILVRPA